MGRFKVKKQDTFIDMTPMSDVMVLLLTFFIRQGRTYQGEHSWVRFGNQNPRKQLAYHLC